MINVVNIGVGELAEATLYWYDGTGREICKEEVTAVNDAEEALQLIAAQKGLTYAEAYGPEGLGGGYISDVTLLMLWHDVEY